MQAVTDDEVKNNELPSDDDAFDAYVANEQFTRIQRVEVMESFLLRCARRFHVLNAEMSTAVNADRVLPSVKQQAWEFGHFNFGPHSDLRMFFSETDDYQDQSTQERKRLNAVADSLVGSARNALQIDLVHAANEKIHAQQCLAKIDQAFDRLNSVLDASGALEADSTQRAVYTLRLAIVEALGDEEGICAAKASLVDLGQ